MDESRRALADRVARNLRQQNEKLCFFPNLIVFDNASRYQTDPHSLEDAAFHVQAHTNVGYWSAIHWTLNNHYDLFGRRFPFIYIIESDLLHYDMDRLVSAERFLADTPDAGAVRTQEFSVRFRILYDKKWSWLPFARRRSWVAQYNAVTGEPVWFRRDRAAPRIYLSNFHTKLPALNRLPTVTGVFAELACRQMFTEMDFIEAYHKQHPIVGVLDGGIFTSAGNDPAEDLVTGSYTNRTQLHELGYQSTREASIHPAEVNVLASAHRRHQ